MSTRYQRALARLYALQARGIRLGATRMQTALALRGHPERGQVFVHVAGTNGKGSVSAMIEACLRAEGYKTGLYTSPHLHRYVERVRIAGRPISEREATGRIEELLRAFDITDVPSVTAVAPAVMSALPEVTFFELTTLLAIEAFRDHLCDVVVLEVGLGGRLDATNSVPTAVSVITRVARDHTNVLGNSIAGIAREKAGILRRGTPAVIGVREPNARRAIVAEAKRVGVRMAQIDRDFCATSLPDGRMRVRVGKREVAPIVLALAGAHQLDNVACAVAALDVLSRRGFPVSDRSVKRGLAKVRWPARLELLPARSRRYPSFLLDAAHNEDGCAALARFLNARVGTRAPHGKRVLIFGALADKDYRAMLATLAPLMQHVLICEPKVSRAASAAELIRIEKRAQPMPSVAAALKRARQLAGPGGEVVVAGSIFLVADARARLLHARTDPPIRM